MVSFQKSMAAKIHQPLILLKNLTSPAYLKKISGDFNFWHSIP
jgi:hypothetical protein